MPMHILMSLDALGGVWRYAMDLGTALHRRGHSVVFAGQGPQPSPAQRAEAAEIGPLEWGAESPDWMVGTADQLDDTRAWLDTLVRRHAPDLLHLNRPSLAAGRTEGPPCIAVTHSCLATWLQTEEESSVPEHMTRQVLMMERGLHDATATIAPSRTHASLTAAAYGADVPQTIPNASRVPLRTPSAGDGTVVAATRWWDSAKGGGLLDAAAGLVRHPVVMVGTLTGPDGHRFVARHATTPGDLPHRRSVTRIAKASLFVSPSRYESFGIAALEAARAARPLLLADIPVYREIWDGAARFFEPDDPDALAEGINALMESETARMSLGMAAQRRALGFSPWAQARAMEKLYRKALSEAAVA